MHTSRRPPKDLGLSDVAVGTHCGNVTTMLSDAKCDSVIDASVLDTPDGSPPDDRAVGRP